MGTPSMKTASARDAPFGGKQVADPTGGGRRASGFAHVHAQARNQQHEVALHQPAQAGERRPNGHARRQQALAAAGIGQPSERQPDQRVQHNGQRSQRAQLRVGEVKLFADRLQQRAQHLAVVEVEDVDRRTGRPGNATRLLECTGRASYHNGARVLAPFVGLLKWDLTNGRPH